MSNIFQPFVRKTAGAIPLNIGSGVLATPNDTQGLRLDEYGNIYAQLNGSINHYHQGLPFNLHGRLLVSDSGAVTRFDQGIPFNANNLIFISNAAIVRYDQGLSYASTGGIVTADLTPAQGSFNNDFNGDFDL
jgi:hypothetical protein